jgi:hypothetical protein
VCAILIPERSDFVQVGLLLGGKLKIGLS